LAAKANEKERKYVKLVHDITEVLVYSLSTLAVSNPKEKSTHIDIKRRKNKYKPLNDGTRTNVTNV
jgi:hypothetical protein